MQESQGQGPPSANDQVRYPLPSGTRVDHYVVREVLGAGGFGITYLAEHEGLGKLFALKEYFPHAFSFREGRTVRPTSASDGTYNWGLERFVAEAKSIARFKHPAIVDVTHVFEANGTAYMVLAYEEGLDLMGWLKQLGRPPSQNELDRILNPLLGALEEIHKRNMMHRDISPDNLLIREDGKPVLIDFGSAREQIRGRARALSAIVKHGYSPPEQYTSKPELQGPWTDIYALSATLYRAISGILPPDATERFIRDELAPVSVVAKAAYRPGFLEAIDRGLRMKVEERPQSIVEWRESLFRPEALRQPSARSQANGETAADAVDGSQPAPSARARPAQAAGSAPASGSARQSGLVSERRSLEAANALDASGPARAAGSSIPRSERPDLSWIDETDDVVLEKGQDVEAPPPGQAVYYGILGILGGAIAGGLFSIVLASSIATTCFADSCILQYLSICAGIGAIGGGIVGVKLGQAPSSGGNGPAEG